MSFGRFSWMVWQGICVWSKFALRLFLWSLFTYDVSISLDTVSSLKFSISKYLRERFIELGMLMWFMWSIIWDTNCLTNFCNNVKYDDSRINEWCCTKLKMKDSLLDFFTRQLKFDLTSFITLQCLSLAPTMAHRFLLGLVISFRKYSIYWY